jgi:hypothetical protein
MDEGWKDQVREWTSNYFSITDEDGDAVGLLRKVADAIEQLGDIEVLDVTFMSDPDRVDATVTVYFTFDEGA